MNNNVNHTEKDMEQLITETLDRCMSGIDTAPSLRPAVDKKLEENPRPEKRHIPVRRFAVPAVALALCVCLIVTGTHFGMFRWPDRIRTPETKVTAQPVPLAQPKGEGNPSPDGSQQQSLTEKLSRVIASCENAGIRFEVHSAEVYEQHTQVLCSVQDLTGDHRIIAGGLALYPYPGFSQDISGPSITYLLNNGCVEEDRRIWYSLDIRYDGIDDRSDRMVTISADNIPIPQVNGEADEWIMETWSVQLPLKSILKDAADYPEKYSEEFFVSRLRYTVNEDGTATVVGSVGADSSFLWAALVVPEKLDGHPVTSIADGAFSMFHHLESVVLPDSLTSIGARAFSDCYRLENVNFPDSLVSIGDEAFLQANLQNASLPDTLAFIGENAFRLDVGLICSVSEDSYAEKYCRKNSIPYRTRETVTSTPPVEFIQADIPDSTSSEDSAQWNAWGTTPMPPVESLPIELPDSAASDTSAGWDSWGVTPIPPVESLPIELPNSAASDTSAGWDSWGVTPMPPVTPEEPWRKWIAETDSAEKADSLRPVGLCCESEGIRFTVEAASVDDESIDLLYSLEDLEGNRINEETHIWGGVDVQCGGLGETWLRTNGGILYTPGRMSARLSHYLTDGTAAPGQNLSAAFSMDKLALLEHNILDLSPYLAEYGENAKAVDLDAAPSSWIVSMGENPAPLYRVLDVSSPLDISLHPNVRLDGIGMIDDQCHVRLRYVDNDPVAESSADRSFQPLDAVLILSTKANEVYPYSARFDVLDVCWSDPDGSAAEAHELVFPLEEKEEIPLYIRTLTGIVDGDWKVELPLDSIWIGPEDYAGADTPGYYESRLTHTLSENGTAVVKGRTGQEDFMLIRHMVIPAELDGHPVTAIADEAFMDWYGLESVVIPETVTAIGDRAFMGCSNLESVDLAEGLRTIGEQAFFWTSLRKVIIPDSVISFGRNAFVPCSGEIDTEFEIPRTAELISYCYANGLTFTIRDSEPAAEPAAEPVEEPMEVPAEKPAGST